MKTLLTIFFVLSCFALSAQTTPVAADSLYIVTYTTGSLWDQSKKPGEQPHFKEHGARLGQLRKDGVIRFGARAAEKGLIVIAAANYSAAKEIVNADIAVQNQLFNADVQKLNIFYDGCLERKK